MTTPKKTTKRKPPTAESVNAVPDSLSVGGRIVVKVLQRGKSWHQSVNPFEWSLPTQDPIGSWTPGKWTPKVPAVRCESGYHGTRCAPKWWGEDAVAYWMEYHPDAKIIAPEGDAEDKFCGEQCRLLRPLSRAELEAQGVYLTGKHESIGEDGGNFVVGGDAEINYVRGGTINYVRGGTIHYVSGGTINDVRGGTINDVRGGTIHYVSGGTINDVRGGTIHYVSGGTIHYVSGGTIHYVSGGTINDVSGGTIHYVSGGTINDVSGGTINDVSGGTINDVSGGTINDVSGGTINDVRGGTINDVSGGTINDVRGGTINDVRGGTITAHAASDAVIVVRWNRPTVTVRGNASVLDYRGSRPVHYIADAGMSLTLASDGSVSQTKEPA